MTLADAISTAHTRSVADKCTTYINARVRLVRQPGTTGRTVEVTYSISDWFCSDSTVATVDDDGVIEYAS